MKLPNRIGTLTVLAVLLAGMSMGFISWCEFILGIEPGEGENFVFEVEAGETISNWAGLLALLERLALCEALFVAEDGSTIAAEGGSTIPPGVYLRTTRDLRGAEPTASVDLITSASTPPGRYLISYQRAGLNGYVTGTCDLTVLPGAHPVTACIYVYQDGEVIVVNQPVNFYGCCSSSPKDDPIVQYRWWWDYNGNPNSAPSQTTTTCLTTHTYATTGTKNARLVVRTDSGEEAEDLQAIVVQAGGPQ